MLQHKNSCFVLAVMASLMCAAIGSTRAGERERGVVRCANLIYGSNKTSKCFSSEFLAETERKTNIVAEPKFTAVRLDSADLYQYPFSVMTGEDAFTMTDEQRASMRTYLTSGGFVVASAGCSSRGWADSFRQEIAKVFPEIELKKLDISHPLFHTVYEIDDLGTKHSGEAELLGLEVDGKIVLVFSADGLNDTGKAGGNCCCCGGSEIRNARQINVNLFAYTLTH